MVHHLFAIRDGAANMSIGPIITVRHQIEASRAFMQLALDPQSNIGRNPEDFALWYIGTYDDLVMEVTRILPECIITAQDCLRIAKRANEEEAR